MSPENILSIDYSAKGPEYRAQMEKLRREKQPPSELYCRNLTKNLSNNVAKLLSAQKQKAN